MTNTPLRGEILRALHDALLVEATDLSARFNALPGDHPDRLPLRTHLTAINDRGAVLDAVGGGAMPDTTDPDQLAVCIEVHEARAAGGPNGPRGNQPPGWRPPAATGEPHPEIWRELNRRRDWLAEGVRIHEAIVAEASSAARAGRGGRVGGSDLGDGWGYAEPWQSISTSREIGH
ncbi:MAG: hypothetical protein O3B31_11335 [Chloroflexi bacterium]|nr:hypothetical protein [Chloroflexota bacterium]